MGEVLSAKMIKVTDADRSVIYHITATHVKVVGFFKDMMDVAKGGPEDPIIMNETPDMFADLMAWLFRSPDFKVTDDKVYGLLELSHKYHIPKMAEEIGDALIAAAESSLTKSYQYTVGACFDVQHLEKAYESSVIETFGSWICSEEAQLLRKWNPEKLLILTQKAWKANSLEWKTYFDHSSNAVDQSRNTLYQLTQGVQEGRYQSMAKGALATVVCFQDGDVFGKAKKAATSLVPQKPLRVRFSE